VPTLPMASRWGSDTVMERGPRQQHFAALGARDITEIGWRRRRRCGSSAPEAGGGWELHRRVTREVRHREEKSKGEEGVKEGLLAHHSKIGVAQELLRWGKIWSRRGGGV
jgi:hypothetical protein